MKVKVYTTTTCPWCHRVTEFLAENKVEFQEVNVAENKEAAKEMVEKTGQMGVPVIDIDGDVIVGFDEPALREKLKLK